MTDTERRAYVWLAKQLPGQDLMYQHRASPDFLSQDGRGYEVKRFSGYKIHLARTQWESLHSIEDCYILVFDGRDEPLEVIPLKGTVLPLKWGLFTIDVLPNPLDKYKEHLDILAEISGKGLKKGEFWQEYRRVQAERQHRPQVEGE